MPPELMDRCMGSILATAAGRPAFEVGYRSGQTEAAVNRLRKLRRFESFPHHVTAPLRRAQVEP